MAGLGWAGTSTTCVTIKHEELTGLWIFHVIRSASHQHAIFAHLKLWFYFESTASRVGSEESETGALYNFWVIQ